jgi:phage baseplate assembly protein W
MANYYKGLAYPFKMSETAFPAPVTDAQLVKESLLQILQTSKGERVMRPAFGCNLQQYVFENNDDLLGQLLRTEISSAIGRWEPRASLNDIQFDKNDTALTVTVTYTLVTTQTEDTLQVVVPANTGG